MLDQVLGIRGMIISNLLREPDTNQQPTGTEFLPCDYCHALKAEGAMRVCNGELGPA